MVTPEQNHERTKNKRRHEDEPDNKNCLPQNGVADAVLNERQSTDTKCKGEENNNPERIKSTSGGFVIRNEIFIFHN